MPKLENGLNGSFRLDGFGYQKGDYEPDYGKGSKFGLRRKGTRGEDSDYLVKPLPPGEWTDNTDTPFASVSDISTYLESFFFRKTATSLVTNEEVVNTYNDLPDPTLHNGEFWVVLTTTNNGLIWPLRVVYSEGTWRSNGTIWEFKGANVPAYLLDDTFIIRDNSSNFGLGVILDDLTANRQLTLQDKDGIISVNPTTLVEIQSLSDFPAPSGGIITLNTPNVYYFIKSTIDFGANRIVIAADNIKIEGVGSEEVTLTSTTTGDFISATNYGLIMQKVTLTCPSSNYAINITGNGNQFLSLDSVTFSNCNDLIRVSDLLAFVDVGPSQWNTFTNGVLMEGTIPNILIQSTLVQSFTGIAIDFNSCLTSAPDVSEMVVYLPTGATFINIAANGANIINGGSGSIRANKAIDVSGGDPVGTFINNYTGFELEWAVILNTDNINPSDRFSPNGWGFYVDDLTIPTINVTTTPTQLTINSQGAATDNSRLPRSIRGIAPIWDDTFNHIESITEGDSYDLRVQVIITSLTSNPARLSLVLDIGPTPDGTGVGPNSIVIAETSRTLKPGVPQAYVFTFPFFTLATFIANKGTLWFFTDTGSLTIGGRELLIVRTSSGAN